MATEPTIAAMEVGRRYSARSYTALADYWALTKPEVNFLMAIAWMYREDYAQAGYLVLPRSERRGRVMAWQSVMPLLVLALMIPTPVLLGRAGLLYLIGASTLSAGFLCVGAQLALRKSNLTARQPLFASIIYLPLVFILLMLDRR